MKAAVALLLVAALAAAMAGAAGAASIPAYKRDDSAEGSPLPLGDVVYAARAPPHRLGQRFNSADLVDSHDVISSRRRCPHGYKLDALNICREIWN